MNWLLLLLLFYVASFHVVSPSPIGLLFTVFRIAGRFLYRSLIRSVFRKPILKYVARGTKGLSKHLAKETAKEGATEAVDRYLESIRQRNKGHRGRRDLDSLYDDADPYLIYLSETPTDWIFYKTDFDFQNVEELSSIDSQENEVDNLFLDPDEELVYWSYKNSPLVGCLNITGVGHVPFVEDFRKGMFAITVGLGYGGTVYLYYPETKELREYIYESGNLVQTLNGLKKIDANLKCFVVSPLDTKHIFFDDCSGESSTAKVFDVNKDKIDEIYNEALPKCFDKWKISPNVARACAVRGKEIYQTLEEKAGFEKYFLADDNIVGFAVGNDELFYTTQEPGKIFKVTNGTAKHFNVEGTVRAMVIY